MRNHGTGGWTLHLVCTTCGTEDDYRGVLIDFAASTAERDGWTLDREALHVAARDRYAQCPAH